MSTFLSISASPQQISSTPQPADPRQPAHSGCRAHGRARCRSGISRRRHCWPPTSTTRDRRRGQRGAGRRTRSSSRRRCTRPRTPGCSRSFSTCCHSSRSVARRCCRSSPAAPPRTSWPSTTRCGPCWPTSAPRTSGRAGSFPSSHIRVFADGGVVIEPASLAPLAQVTDEFLTTVQRLDGWAVVPGRVDAVRGAQVSATRREPGSAGRAGGGGRSPADAPVDRPGGRVRHPVRPAVCQHPADRGARHRFRRAERGLPDPAGERGNRRGWRAPPLRRGDRRGETGLDVPLVTGAAGWPGG